MPRDTACEKCSLHAIALHRCVPGRVWNIASERLAELPYRLLCVGENPGRQEDEQDQVFVGPSGGRLAHALAEAEIHAAFFTNATRCTKGAQTIKAAHLKACADYLEEEIAAWHPTHILVLGAVAAKRILGATSIEGIAGKLTYSERYQCWVMPVLHPNAILRDPGKEVAWRADIGQLAKHIRGELHDHIPVAVLTPQADYSLLNLAQALTHGLLPLVALDFESIPKIPEQRAVDTVVPWWHKEFKPYSIAFGIPTSAFIVPLDHPEAVANPTLSREAKRIAVAAITQAMQERRFLSAAHNWLYDALVWYRLMWDLDLDPVVPEISFDTMLAAGLDDENSPKRLKWLGQTKLGWPNWDINAGEEHPLAELCEYNGYDAGGTACLTVYYGQRLHGTRLEAYFDQLVMPTVNAVARMMARGVYIDPVKLANRREENKWRLMAAKEKVPVVNPGSPQQVAKWLYEDLKLPVLKLTPTGKPSTDEDTINTLALNHPEVRVVLPYRKHARYESTYFADMAYRLEHSIDGRAHYDYRYGNVETGRLSSPFHTIPRDPFVKGVVSAPPGRVLTSADYSQIEARIVAWKAAGCPATWEEVDPAEAPLLWAFHEGTDVYKLQAGAVLGKAADRVTKDERQQLGKVPTLAFLYGMMPKTYVATVWKDWQMVVTLREAEHIRTTFFKLWPEIARWHRREERLIRAKGYVQTCLGRIRRLPAAQGEGIEAIEAVKSGINVYGQGPAADITLKAHHLVDQWCEGHRATADPFVVGSVHDALLVESNVDYALDVARGLHSLMLAAHHWLEPLGMRLPPGLLAVEVARGPWGEPEHIYTTAELLAAASPALLTASGRLA